MNGLAFLLMMLSQMNQEELVMVMKKPLKKELRKEEIALDEMKIKILNEAQILTCRIFKKIFSELEEEISNEK